MKLQFLKSTGSELAYTVISSLVSPQSREKPFLFLLAEAIPSLWHMKHVVCHSTYITQCKMLYCSLTELVSAFMLCKLNRCVLLSPPVPFPQEADTFSGSCIDLKCCGQLGDHNEFRSCLGTWRQKTSYPKFCQACCFLFLEQLDSVAKYADLSCQILMVRLWSCLPSLFLLCYYCFLWF